MKKKLKNNNFLIPSFLAGITGLGFGKAVNSNNNPSINISSGNSFSNKQNLLNNENIEFSKNEELNLFNQVAEPSIQLGPSPQESFEQDYDLEVEWQDSHFEEVKHIFSHRKWHVRILSGQVVDSKEYCDKEVVWLTPEEFDLYPLAKPQQKIWQEYSKRC